VDTRKEIIIAKGRVLSSIYTYRYNLDIDKYDITFESKQEFITYTYSAENIVLIKNPERLNPKDFLIKVGGKTLNDIAEIYEFKKENHHYWHLIYKSGVEQSYARHSLTIYSDSMKNIQIKSVFNYMRQVAKHILFKVPNGEVRFASHYDKIEYIEQGSALSSYFNPEIFPIKTYLGKRPIFPFGCNASQFKAVNLALTNQISVIQGPPGTGKTQTILNIIANLLVDNKTVLIASNNNAAIENVLDKLKLPQYSLGFLAAMLGKTSNKVQFIENQNYREFPDVIKACDPAVLADDFFKDRLQKQYDNLHIVFTAQEEIAKGNIELQALKAERQHFEQHTRKAEIFFPNVRLRKSLKSKVYLDLLEISERRLKRVKSLTLRFKLKARFIYGVADWAFYNKKSHEIITFLQLQFYKTRQAEIEERIQTQKEILIKHNQNDLVEKFSKQCLVKLHAIINKQNKGMISNVKFSLDDLQEKASEFQKAYPIVLTTTFASRSSLSQHARFDYIIIDEASQVDVATGSLALSCAKNAVIVGDEKQLPNIVSQELKKELEYIDEVAEVSQGYLYTQNSLLSSVSCVLPEAPKTLLREHYRCHPKIIHYCNQKFYNGDLLIMTEDNEEDAPISLFKTVKGNHQRERMNQRQIDVIEKEVLPTFTLENYDIGIITPYRNQVISLNQTLGNTGIEIDTVHKFQGREKEAIILSTVDNKLTDFSDDPYLLNVAISRAKKQLCVIVSGNEQPKDSNIQDLIDYIQYYNGVVESKTNSIFDYLYEQYKRERHFRLTKSRKVSKYDSENLMYGLIKEVLQEQSYSTIGVCFEYRLSLLIRDYSLLNEVERNYVSNELTHVDFLLYNRISKRPILAIEVDGHSFHKAGTAQAVRDGKKNKVLERYDIPLLRFHTTGSEEKSKLVENLKSIMQST
jgi:superfamily I DNA and/or RNA helicase